MASEDSDDEPLAVLAAAKQSDPSTLGGGKLVSMIGDCNIQPKKKKLKTKSIAITRPPLTISFGRELKKLTQAVVNRPEDVWLYLKDFNQFGPYSCLLCSEWFVNKSKIVIHYILNHKKDFCGICRYFVADRGAWEEHTKFHTPWQCSQCLIGVPTQSMLREHLSEAHKLVYCRLCYFRLAEGDQYHEHLLQKHNIINVSAKNEETFWQPDQDGNNFTCLLCNKTNNPTLSFFGHYMCYHHFTLKCFTSIISGKNLPFMIFGANISPEFIEGLRDKDKWGYTDLELKPLGNSMDPNRAKEDNESILTNLLIDIKQEILSDHEDVKKNNEEKESGDKNEETKIAHEFGIEVVGEKVDDNKEDILWDSVKSYKGDEDFDVASMELIVLEKPYFDYVSQGLTDLNANQVTLTSEITYDKKKGNVQSGIICELCSKKYHNKTEFSTHMHRMHCVKSVPMYSCRICATTFHTHNELSGHINSELGDFEELWICQFCDLEFNDRPSTRQHLTDHWDIIDSDNCFSPHLGFKCRYCPVLFWHEFDREQHHVGGHFHQYTAEFYKCTCNEVFSDKIWFTYHYLNKHNKNTHFLFKCCVCATVLASVQEMRVHFEKTHPEARKLFCSLDNCSYRPLSQRKSFAMHVKTQHTPAPGTQRGRDCACDVCGREFPSPRSRSVHVAQAHAGVGRYRCKICGDMLQTTDERKLHYLIRHPGQHPYECKECGKTFQYKSSLYIHKKDHSPIKHTYTCSYCQKVFHKKDSFREHLLIHEGPRHACSYCPMRFVQRSNMLRHERRHTGERPYSCSHCDRTFADKGACSAHIRSHSKDTSYACVYCGQTFVQKSKLTYHLRKHTGENLETCPVCSKLFTSGCSLRQHMKSHDEKARVLVACPLCDKKYRDERNMLRHLRETHTGAHLPCPLCRKAFSSAIGLRHHVLTHARTNIFRCNICPKSYAVKRSLIKHLRVRHNLKNLGNANLKQFYKKLEPRECRLNLDEETITSIFGPPKRRLDIPAQDYITFTNANQLAGKSEEKDDDEKVSEDDEQDDVEQGSDGEEETMTDVGTEVQPLEPDFVSVKIEPVDEDHT